MFTRRTIDQEILRHTLIVLLCSLGLLMPEAAGAQVSRVARLGFLSSGAPQTQDQWARHALVVKLRELGWEEGRNLMVERRYAASAADLAKSAVELIDVKVEIIFANGGPAIDAAKQASRSTPIVMLTFGDPVDAGFVKSSARPDGNVTGVAGFAPGLGTKRLQLLAEALPATRRVGVMGNSNNPQWPGTFREMLKFNRPGKLELRHYDVTSPAGLEAAFTAMAHDRIQGFVVVSDPIITSQPRKLIELAARHRLPAIYELHSLAEGGGFMTFGPNIDDMYRRSAVYVHKIFAGAKPGDLPIEFPTNFELVVNLKTAKALGVVVPQSVLLRADRVIE